MNKYSLDRVIGERSVEATESKLVLGKYHVLPVPVTVTTPDVLNVERLIFQNVAPVTVTNFINGQLGQEISLLGDGQTTLQDNSVGGNPIYTNTGANKLLVANRAYKLIKDANGNWIEFV